MSKKGSGGADTSGLEQATAEATALQKMIYEQTREDSQPWYNAGVGGISKLSDLLGISGGSVQDRQTIYDEMLPQYTSQNTSPQSGMWQGVGGQLYGSQDEAFNDAFQNGNFGGDEVTKRNTINGIIKEYQPESTGESIDYTGLNSAVDERLSNQTPSEDFGTLLQPFDLDKFEEDPSYQYRKQEAEKALERGMAAQGITLGGGGYGDINPQVAKALQEQSQGMASQEYNNAYNRYNIDQSNTYNRLMGIAGMGQGSTAQMANSGQSYANNTGNLTTGLASAQLNAQMAADSQPGMFSGLLGAAGQIGGAWAGSEAGSAALTSFFSDIRLKENIKLVDVKNRHNIYEFDYKDGSGRYRGVMAHEVQKIEPDAVKEAPNGYLMVDYGKLGLEMEAV